MGKTKTLESTEPPRTSESVAPGVVVASRAVWVRQLALLREIRPEQATTAGAPPSVSTSCRLP